MSAKTTTPNLDALFVQWEVVDYPNKTGRLDQLRAAYEADLFTNRAPVEEAITDLKAVLERHRVGKSMCSCGGCRLVHKVLRLLKSPEGHQTRALPVA